MEQKDILKEPLQNLPFTESFYLRSKLMGFRSISDIVENAPDDLLAREDFNYSWLGELVKFLIKNKMLDKLQGLPEKTPY